MNTISSLLATSGFGSSLVLAGGDAAAWLGYQVLEQTARGFVLAVGEAADFPVVCIDERGEVRAVRTLKVSGRRRVSLI